MRVDVYSRHDAYIGTISPNELLSFVHTDELNGEDSVAISTTYHLKEGYRLLWQDNDGNNHEHVCQDPKGTHADGTVIYTDTALNSICETFGDYIEDKRPYSYSYAEALAVALAPTRWKVGTVDQTGTVSSGLTFYHTSARAAINDILECGGELETVITVSNGVIAKRAVNIRAHRGSTSGHKRFAYGKDINTCAKTEHYGAITACYGYGKGVETDSGGYGRKLTFGDINGGLNYVADSTALKTYGRPNGSGGFAHVFGTYENSSCDDAAQLLSETKEYLASHNEPGVTYTADVVDLVQFGRTWEGVSVGDDVQMVDTEFSPELRCTGRVSAIKTDYLHNQRTVTLGNVTETLTDYYIQQTKTVNGLSQRSANWDVASNTPAAYLQQIIDGLNEQFNTNGMSYCYTSFETGTIWSSVPLDENGKPTKTGGSAIQICSQGFRIASTTKSDGSYDWRTFGTGTGFTADEINAGTLNADLIKTGMIKGEGIPYWDLDSGELISSKISTSSQGYVSCGEDNEGKLGFSLYSSADDSERFGLQARYARSDPTSKGLHMQMMDRVFLEGIARTGTVDPWVALFPPYYSEPEANEKFGSSGLIYPRIIIRNDSIFIMMSADHYFAIWGDTFQCRLGKKGFQFSNGVFTSDLTWSD